LAECFQYRSDNIYPLELLNPQIHEVERKEDHGMFVDLYETQQGEVKHKLLTKYDNKPVLEHPIDPKRSDKAGVIQIWEFPPPNNQAAYGVYWAGVDIVRDSESMNSQSLNCIHIYKGTHNLSQEFGDNRIVAKYMSRPKDKMDWFKKAIMLMDYYNAEALVENNVKTIYIALDNDALKDSIKHCEKLLNLGKEVYLIELDGKDPSDIGFEQFTKLLHTATQLTFSELFTKKVELTYG
jgi:hypothetical protein